MSPRAVAGIPGRAGCPSHDHPRILPAQCAKGDGHGADVHECKGGNTKDKSCGGSIVPTGCNLKTCVHTGRADF